MKNIKDTIKLLLPNFIIRFLTGLFYGWHGNYLTWQEAKQKCTGYEAGNILKTVENALFKVKNGTAVYERDSVIFDEVEYSFPLLTSLMAVAAQNKGRLNIIDFGGSLGSTYFQNKKFLDLLSDVNWCVVEQPNFVESGKKNFSDNRLKFYYNIDECIESNEIDAVLLSSVIQYIENPYELLNNLISRKIKFIIFDRVGFIKGDDRITIQKVNPSIYRASYPCWFFNKANFLNFMKKHYDLVSEFESLDITNIVSEFKGYLYRIKN